MNDRQTYIKNRLTIAWGLLVLGVVFFLVGLAFQYLFTVPINAKIVSGLGIFFAGLGLSQALRYWSVQKNSQAMTRIVNEERDERNYQIRTRAGHRAFWVSMVMIYTGLMWVSFASSGSLPVLSLDGSWWYLAATFVVPLGVYIVSMVIEQNKS